MFLQSIKWMSFKKLSMESVKICFLNISLIRCIKHALIGIRITTNIGSRIRNNKNLQKLFANGESISLKFTMWTHRKFYLTKLLVLCLKLRSTQFFRFHNSVQTHQNRCLILYLYSSLSNYCKYSNFIKSRLSNKSINW